MPFELSKYNQLRPLLYHLTAQINLSSIKENKTLQCAERLLLAGGRPDALANRRPVPLRVRINALDVQISDQSPLHEANIQFHDGWSFTDLIQSLNKRVFFWAGTGRGPIAHGRRHFERYLAEGGVILRVPLAEVLLCNPGIEPSFCRFNSGSPRCVGGRRSPRGSDTFAPASQAAFNPGDVVEVAFLGAVRLPSSVERLSPEGQWSKLF